MIDRLIPNHAMTAALGARRADRALADRLHLFGQFIGSWDLDVRYHPVGAPERRLEGEWHFGWVLEGRALQDVWITPRRALRRRGPEPGWGDYGTTLRFYDPKIEAWRSTWIGPERGVVRCFVARPVGDEIVLEGSFEPGAATRWIFSRITPVSFHWRAVESRDNWRTERRQQEMFAVRRSTARAWMEEFSGPPRLQFRGII